MPSPNLDIAHVAASQNQKEVTVNDAIDALDRALTETSVLDCTIGGTITATNAQVRRSVRLDLQGTPAAAFTLTLPALPRVLVLSNGTGQTATVGNATGATIDVEDGATVLIVSTGTGVLLVGSAGGGVYDFGMVAAATPTASEVLAKVVVPRAITLAADLAGSYGHVDTPPAAGFVIDVQKNATSIGTITIATDGSFSFATTGAAAVMVAAGDVIRFQAPAAVDAAIAGIAVTLAGALA